MQWADKNMLDILGKIAAFTKKAVSVKGRYRKCVRKFAVLLFFSNLLEKKNMMLPSDLRSVFVQHLSKLALKFAQYFPEDLSSYKWIRDPYVQAIPSSFTEEETEDNIDLTCDSFLNREV